MEDGKITIEWTMSSTAHVNNYEVQWAPADVAGWSPSGAGYPSGPPFTFLPEVGGRSPFGAWKVRVRGRKWRPNVSYCCVGPWSDTVVIEEYRPVQQCYVGQVLEPGDSCLMANGFGFEVRSDGYGCLSDMVGAPICLPLGIAAGDDIRIFRIAGTDNWRVDVLPED